MFPAQPMMVRKPEGKANLVPRIGEHISYKTWRYTFQWVSSGNSTQLSKMVHVWMIYPCLPVCPLQVVTFRSYRVSIFEPSLRHVRSSTLTEVNMILVGGQRLKPGAIDLEGMNTHFWCSLLIPSSHSAAHHGVHPFRLDTLDLNTRWSQRYPGATVGRGFQQGRAIQVTIWTSNMARGIFNRHIMR